MNKNANQLMTPQKRCERIRVFFRFPIPLNRADATTACLVAGDAIAQFCNAMEGEESRRFKRKECVFDENTQKALWAILSVIVDDLLTFESSELQLNALRAVWAYMRQPILTEAAA